MFNGSHLLSIYVNTVLRHSELEDPVEGHDVVG
jgi:hypothetical protein